MWNYDQLLLSFHCQNCTLVTYDKIGKLICCLAHDYIICHCFLEMKFWQFAFFISSLAGGTQFVILWTFNLILYDNLCSVQIISLLFLVSMDHIFKWIKWQDLNLPLKSKPSLEKSVSVLFKWMKTRKIEIGKIIEEKWKKPRKKISHIMLGYACFDFLLYMV